MTQAGSLDEALRATLRAVHTAPRKAPHTGEVARLIELGLVANRHCGLVLTSRGFGALRAGG